MLPKDERLNIKRSLYKYLREHLSADYWINYGAPGDPTLEERIRARVANYWQWIDIHWIKMGQGIFSTTMIQIHCNTIMENDPYRNLLDNMHDDIQEQLNVDTIDLLDFSSDPLNPVPTDNVLIPRYRGTRQLADAAGGTVNVDSLDFNLYIWRESVLP